MGQSFPSDLRNVSPDDRVAVDKIAASISWHESKYPGVHNALVMMAYREHIDDYAAVKRDVLCAAVALALQRKEVPQPIRIGKNWVNGSRNPVIPISLSTADFTVWVEQETHTAACALALGTPYPDNEQGENEYKALIAHLNAEDQTWDSKYRSSRLTTSLRNIFTDRGGDDEEEEAVFDWYHYDYGEATALHRAIDALSPSEKEIIKAFETEEPLASVARRTGRNAAAVRQDAKRLKDKVRRQQAKIAEEIQRERYSDLDDYDDGEYERAIQEAKSEATALWERKCREDPKFLWSVATLWMVHRRNIKRPVVQAFRDYSEMKSRSPSKEDREQLTANIKRILDYVFEEARQDWIYENKNRIQRQKWDEAE